jgi:hypothetical protein
MADEPYVWCKECGHEFEEHSFISDAKTKVIEETYCHHGAEFVPKDDQTVQLVIKCPCKIFIELKTGKEVLKS